MSDWVTTSTMLDRLKRFDDRVAWDRFAARFQKPIIAFALRLGLNAPDAEDVAQESLIAFMQAYREGKYKREAGRLSSWLFGIAYRQAANVRRKKGRAAEVQVTPEAPTEFWSGVPDEAQATPAWQVEWERAALEECMQVVRREVEEKTYRAFEMLVREGRTPDDVAKALGMTRDAVYVSKHRVLKRLSELAKEYDEAGVPEE